MWKEGIDEERTSHPEQRCHHTHVLDNNLYEDRGTNSSRNSMYASMYADS